MNPAPRTARVIVLLAVGYLVLGMAGLLLAIPPGYASPVFPASGLALACILRFGWRALPGVWIGSLLLNVSHAWVADNLSPTTALVAVVIATGASAQAAAGRALVARLLGANGEELEREQDALAFLLLGGLLAGLVAATVSVSGLVASGVIDRAEIRFTWWTWYVGDALGVLVFAPLCLCFLPGGGRLWTERRHRIAGPVLVALALVALAFHATARWEADAEQARLAEEGAVVAGHVSDRIIAHREVLAALRNFMEATPGVTFPQFEHFTRLTLRDNPDVFALSFNDRVVDEDRAGFEESMGRLSPVGAYRITQRDPENRLVTATRRPEYVAVRYIVPLEANRPAVGFDILSEPVRRTAIEVARETGRMAVTAPIRLVQERQERVGVLELMPVFTVPSAESPEVPSLAGFAVAVIKLDEMIRIATRGVVPEGMAFELTDPRAPAGRGLLYRSADWDGGAIRSGRAGSTWSTVVGEGGPAWSLTVAITEGHRQAHRPWAAWAVGVVGLLFAALFQVLMLGTTGRAAVIERKNEALLLADKVFEYSGSSIVVTDPDGNAISVNPAFTAVTGYEQDEIRGKNLRIVNSGRHPPEFFREMWRCLLEEHGWQGEIWNRRKNGEPYLEWLTIKAVRDPAGVTTHYVGSFIDITARRALEEKLATASRLAAMGTLVAGVAHEINNPLAGAMGAQGTAIEIVRALQARLPEDGTPDRAAIAGELGGLLEALQDAEVGAGRISRIVKDLTLLGRGDAPRGRVRLADVVEEALRWLPPSVPRGAAIVVENAAPPDVEASAGQLTQVIINLVTNAAKAIPAGRAGRVVVRIGPGDPGRARIEVADNGVGMAPEVLARVFDPFYTTRRVGEGTGLGLPICNSIVTAHGGTIGVTSTPGEGTSFVIDLPASRATA